MQSRLLFSFTAIVLLLNAQLVLGQFEGPHIISKPFVHEIKVKDIDFDKDGDIDLVTVASGKNGLIWYENQGEGTFSEQQIIGDIPSSANQLQWMDLDLDGYEDLVFRIGGSEGDFPFLQNKLVWSRNNKHQAFDTPASLIPLGEFHDLYIESQDMDGDGDSDFLFYIRQASTYILEWYENTGQQKFSLKNRLVQEDFDWRSYIKVIEDLDEDGDLDFLTSHWQNCHLFDCGFTLYRNNGESGFEENVILTQETTIVSNSKDDCRFAEIADIFDYDLDGKKDIIATINGKSLMWLKNEGSGEYAVPQLIQRYPYQGWFDIDELYFFDIDNNGFKDIFFTDTYDMMWKGYFGGEQTGPWVDIPFTPKYPISWRYDWYGDIYPQDIDKDGSMDFIRVEKNIVEAYQNDGFGGFTQIDSLAPDYEITQLFFNDFDQDGKVDMVIYHEDTRSIWLYQLGGQAEIEEAQLIVQPNISIPHSTLTADLNGDGWIDVLSISLRGNKVIWYPNEGKGIFGEQRLITERGVNQYAETVKPALEFEKQYLGAADLDGDEDIDIVHSLENEDGAILVWQQNDGLGNFSPPIVIAEAATHEYDTWHENKEEAAVIKTVDMDEDGDMDLVVGWTYQLAIYYNNGGGEFTKTFVANGGRGMVKIADLNGDGLLDILTPNENLGWFQNEGDDSFTYQKSSTLYYLDHGTFYSVNAADFDKDGDMDVIANALLWSQLCWHENDGTGHFKSNDVHMVGTSGFLNIEILDWNFDGEDDIIASGIYGTVLFEGNGKGDFEEKYHTHQVGTYPFLSFGSSIADLDNDGDMDIVVESPFFDRIVWYENKITPFLIRGESFLDENKNGTKDTGENSLSNQTLVLNPEDELGYSTGEGRTTFHAAFGDYSLTYQPHNLWELTSSNVVYPIAVTGEENLPIYQFGFYPTRILPKVEPYLSSTITRCNQNVSYWLNYSNTGTTTASGTVSLKVHEQMSLISANPEPDLIEGNTWLWYFSDLSPSQNSQIRLQFQMPGTDWIGENIATQATVEVFNESQELVYTKTDQYDSELLCSFDPNDKLVRTTQMGQSEFAYVKDTLLYTIRFQNTGNDTAFNIRLEDILDRNLDWNSFHPIAASHSYRTTLDRNTGLLSFYFEDILLPDSTTNEIESHGFMMYGITPLQDSHIGVPIHNTAAIYFDFNPPIITNTTENIVVHDLATDIEAFNSNPLIHIYPNPFSHQTTIEVKNLPHGNHRLEVMDILGRKVRDLTLESGKANLQRGDLESGLYLIRVLEEGSNEILGSGKVLVE